MKKIIVMLISMVMLFVAPILAETKTLDASQIKAVYLHISKSLGAVSSYVIFRDESGNSCATSGNLDIIKKIFYEDEDSVRIGYLSVRKNVLKAKEEFLKNIYFEPADFQYMMLRGGDVIYALPIALDPRQINSGDSVVLKWYGFQIEEKVYEF